MLRLGVALLVPLLFAGCGSTLDRLTGPPPPPELPQPVSAGSAGPATRAGNQPTRPISGTAAPVGFVRPGTGTGLGQPLPVVGPPGPGGEVTLNFVDADVTEVVRVVLGDLLGASYVIDPRVRGPVTLDASQGLPRAALVPMLQAALRTQGAGLIEGTQGFEVVPLADARRQSGIGLRGTSGIVPLAPRFASAADIARALAPFLNEEVAASVDASRNLLILSGDQRQLGNLAQLVSALDVDVMGGRSFALYPLRNAAAGPVAEDLQRVFAGTGGVRFLPIQRQNSLLVIANQPGLLPRVAQWVRDLDQAGGRDELQIYVYQVEYGRAGDLARVLGRLFGMPVETADRAPVTDRVVAPGLASSRIVGGGPAPGGAGGGFTPPAGGLGAPGGGLGAPGGGLALPGAPGGVAPGGGFAGAPPRAGQPGAGGAGAFEAEPPAEPDPGSGFAGSGGADPTAPRIMAEPNTNTVVVQATAGDWPRIEAALRRLDQVPLQVLIEATIAEVTLNDRLRFGLQFALRSGSFGFNLAPDGRPGPGLGGAPGGGVPAGGLTLPGIAAPTLPGFLTQIATGTNVGLSLEALATVTNVNVISSPQLMVLSNQTAVLQVGDQVPIAVQSAVPLDSLGGRIVNSIAFRDTGVILRVTPRVNSSGLISMDVEQEVSDVVPTSSSGIDSPTIRQRRLRSTVAVQSGEAVALGGLIRNGVNAARSGLPGLRDLPVVGPLFGSTDSSEQRTELLVLITPRIVRNSDEARSVTAELRARLRGLQPPDPTRAAARRSGAR